MSNFKLAATTLLLSTASAYHARRQTGNENPEVIIAGASSYNGLNLVPQMGWNNWNVRPCLQIYEDTCLQSTLRPSIAM
jgi:alpha-galactosidase